LIAIGQDWVPLRGGQTNQLWRVGDRVVKRFTSSGDNPRFPNNPFQEVEILTHLQGLGLAQDLMGSVEHNSEHFLVFRHLPGHIWRGNTTEVARLLRRVHDVTPPSGLRLQSGGAASIMALADLILPEVPAALADRLEQSRPDVAPVPPSDRRVLLHGDPVPGNIIVTSDGLRLIDWQCPAVGDPVEDLALFLSPAMQVIYRGAPLSQSEISDFTEAYEDSATISRLVEMQPWHHWAMALYCGWKAARGSHQYARAMEYELEALQ
jgi:thiamine kinase-like enzyme